ncbi:hypothetical protein G6F22_019443 [Rhizopus arrhizus]|nr:hypothetical protein G6F22_019443 [Rhizopus arrhizus]
MPNSGHSRHAAGGADDVGGPRLGLLQRWHEVAQQVLQHEAPGTGAGVHRGQDEQRFEQDREVVPERHHSVAAAWYRLVQDLCDAHRQRGCATGAVQDGRLADRCCRGGQLFRGDGEAPGIGDVVRGRRHIRADHRRRAVHREPM